MVRLRLSASALIIIVHGCMKTDLLFAVITLAVGNNHEDTDIIRLIDFLVESHLAPLNLPWGNASADTVILHYFGQALRVQQQRVVFFSDENFHSTQTRAKGISG